MRLETAVPDHQKISICYLPNGFWTRSKSFGPRWLIVHERESDDQADRGRHVLWPPYPRLLHFSTDLHGGFRYRLSHTENPVRNDCNLCVTINLIQYQKCRQTRLQREGFDKILRDCEDIRRSSPRSLITQPIVLL